ncbi:DEAD/DEAH box helicase [Novosphingobium lindaniclasticum]|nr:DEAD/DEAH box helicase [Novosphingobium lindaniclasticum]
MHDIARRGAALSADPAFPVRPAQSLSEMVAVLLDSVEHGDVLFVARDDQRAGEIARSLSAANGEGSVLLCPASDALPGDDAPPTPANAGARTSALRQLRRNLASEARPFAILVTTGEACARLYPPPAAFDAAPPAVCPGDRLQAEEWEQRLCDIGYFADERVDEPGEYAVRGKVIDIYPADAERPYRIELEGDLVSAIHAYDPVSQRTLDPCDRLELGRAREPALEGGVCLLDHFPAARVFVDEGADKRRRALLTLAGEVGRGGSGPAALCAEADWREALAARDVAEPIGAFGETPRRFVEMEQPAKCFAKEAGAVLKQGSVLVVGTVRDLRFLAPRLRKALGRDPVEVGTWREARALPAGSLGQLAMPLARGLRTADMLVVAAADLLGSRAERGDEQVVIADAELFRISELRCGDVVVHEDHGLCVVEGLEEQSGSGEAIVLRFAKDTRRLVPLSHANRIWRYGADEDAVSLDRLDGSTWMKRRHEVEEALQETASGLRKLARQRQEAAAPVLEADPAAYERIADRFPYTETADQARAIAAVREDLASGQPMDRLVVGDVGYGKTEVALRAAAIAALAGRQVVLAVPTTVLARQHLETFTKRFAQSGIVVAGLSRLSSVAEKNAVLKGIAEGGIHIVIGTGAVAGKHVRYADLGLVIIDEEQRFGAGDKKKLRAMGSGHVLALSATPIPRTLQSALVGLQDLSVIATPPARRQPIRTFVGIFEDHRVRSALLREKSRGGQSFVVVPRIEDLAALERRLARLVPELTIIQAHGKMAAGDLDDAMVRFAGGDGDVLLATNIIEAGLDVPRANTMVVWRADRFGLSQLHQLRGRVGRSARRGQILLLTEPEAQVAPRTLARLNTLAALDRLGAGFAISARDLDMRGAGDLLGEEQSGHARLLGVDLYQHLLGLALARARGETAEDDVPVVKAGSEGMLPGAWIPDVDLRLGLYARLARLGDLSALESFADELEDRFGTLPAEALRLLDLARLRLLARSARIGGVEAGPAAIALTPAPGRRGKLAAPGLRKSKERYLLSGNYEDEESRLAAALDLVASLR